MALKMKNVLMGFGRRRSEASNKASRDADFQDQSIGAVMRDDEREAPRLHASADNGAKVASGPSATSHEKQDRELPPIAAIDDLSARSESPQLERKASTRTRDMAKPGKCVFRELDSERIVEVNPLAIRLLRRLDSGTEIVFSEAHSIKVKAGFSVVGKIIEEKNPLSVAAE